MHPNFPEVTPGLADFAGMLPAPSIFMVPLQRFFESHTILHENSHYFEYSANFISLLSHVDEETLQAVLQAIRDQDFVSPMSGDNYELF
jgi:hypothetical protein